MNEWIIHAEIRMTSVAGRCTESNVTHLKLLWCTVNTGYQEQWCDAYTGECIIHDKKLNTVAENGASLTGNCYMLLSGQNAFLCWSMAWDAFHYQKVTRVYVLYFRYRFDVERLWAHGHSVSFRVMLISGQWVTVLMFCSKHICGLR